MFYKSLFFLTQNICNICCYISFFTIFIVIICNINVLFLLFVSVSFSDINCFCSVVQPSLCTVLHLMCFVWQYLLEVTSHQFTESFCILFFLLSGASPLCETIHSLSHHSPHARIAKFMLFFNYELWWIAMSLVFFIIMSSELATRSGTAEFSGKCMCHFTRCFQIPFLRGCPHSLYSLPVYQRAFPTTACPAEWILKLVSFCQSDKRAVVAQCSFNLHFSSY